MGIDPYAGCNVEILNADCTLETCCLAQSPFHYIPSLGGNIFFAVYFGVFCFPQIWLGIRYRTTGFTIGMIIGLALEVVGYAGRVILHDNPFDPNGFLIYLICITIAPVFISASIYLSIVRIINLYGEHLSFLKPRTIAILFMTSDFCSLVLQAAGGAIADTSTHDLQQTGIHIMIAGLFLQAISLAVFLFILAVFALRCRTGSLDMTPEKVACRRRSLYKVFLFTLLLATVAILVRSIFRVAELWEGFSGTLWNDETEFMVLDGGMVGLATLLLTIFHPGPAFDDHWNAADWSSSSKRKTNRRRSRGHKKAYSSPNGSQG